MKRTITDSDWIKISQNGDARVLRLEVEKLQQRWPGRYRFAIIPVAEPEKRVYSLYLKHA